MVTDAMPSTRNEVDFNQPTMPLSFVPSGSWVQIREIRGGHRLRQRLYALGLNQGASVRVLKNDVTGPLILAVKDDGRLALGRGMAYHILVEA